MIVSDILNFNLLGVYDRGIANKERIVIKVLDNTNLGQYGVFLGIKVGEGAALPVNNMMFWFGDGIAEKNSWILLYTGPGENRRTTLKDSPEKAYVLHWGFKNTVLNEKIIVPILFKVEQVAVEKNSEFIKKLTI